MGEQKKKERKKKRKAKSRLESKGSCDYVQNLRVANADLGLRNSRACLMQNGESLSLKIFSDIIKII